MYTVDLYNNTGYNVENIPDSAALLGTPSISKTAVDTIQNYVMSSVRISAVFDDVKNADYCKIGDFYYFVTGVTMTSRDVAVLSLIPDYITSYGLSTLKFLDGITVRHHVDNDGYGDYIEDDPLMYCNEPLRLINGGILFKPTGSDLTIAMSTADLMSMGDPTHVFAGTSYTDANGNTVTVPHLEPVTTFTTFYMGQPNHISGTDYKGFNITGQQAFLVTGGLNSLDVQRGMQFCRDIAAESAITAQYSIPSDWIKINGSAFDPSTNNVIASIAGLDQQNGVSASSDPNMFWDFAAGNNLTVKNNRVLYGKYCTYGIITMNGNRLEAQPELIYSSAQQYGPKVTMKVDPRPDGCPYFRFETYYGTSVYHVTSEGYFASDPTFWQQAIAGQKWYQVPLVFTSASGIYQTQKYHDTSLQLLEANRENQLMSRRIQNVAAVGDLALSVVGGLGVTGGGTVKAMSPNAVGAYNANPASIQTAASGTFTPSMGMLNGLANFANMRATQRDQDTQYSYDQGKLNWEYAMAKNVVVPDIMFPYTDGTLRDLMGNGVMMYRYLPTVKDIQLQDKLLTMYGYRVTDKMDKKYFYNRQYFNYVQASNISIGNNLPQWWKAGIVAQLAAGVRVWHVTPNETHYDNNPIVVNP